MARLTYYGERRLSVSKEEFERWAVKERARMREVMRLRRAAARQARMGAFGIAEPAYPEAVLASMTRWIDAHRARDKSCDLAEVVHLMRKAARAEGLADEVWDRIQDRGAARLLRSMGFELIRSAAGMVVIGLDNLSAKE